MNYPTIISLVALVSVVLNIFLILNEVHHRSLVAEVTTALQQARAAITTDVNKAKASIDNALASLRAKLP